MVILLLYSSLVQRTGDRIINEKTLDSFSVFLHPLLEVKLVLFSSWASSIPVVHIYVCLFEVSFVLMRDFFYFKTSHINHNRMNATVMGHFCICEDGLRSERSCVYTSI